MEGHQLGRLVAETRVASLEKQADAYIELFSTAMRQHASKKKHVNVLEHIRGYLKKDLDKSDKRELGDSIGTGEDVALVNGETDELLGILNVEEKYSTDSEFECSHVFRTTDTGHPGVEKVMSQGPVNLGGPVRTVSETRSTS